MMDNHIKLWYEICGFKPWIDLADVTNPDTVIKYIIELPADLANDAITKMMES